MDFKHYQVEQAAFHLCYADEGVAWFTTRDILEQWGDDWNDAPYEHNAGTPYNDLSDPPAWVLCIRSYTVGPKLVEPKNFDAHSCNSPFSVQDINRGAIPWLTTRQVPCSPGKHVDIFAGATPLSFANRIRVAGGDCGPVVLDPYGERTSVPASDRKTGARW